MNLQAAIWFDAYLLLLDISHQEDAWKHYHEGNQIIPYSEAFSL